MRVTLFGVAVGYSATIADPRGCHCNRRPLYEDFKHCITQVLIISVHLEPWPLRALLLLRVLLLLGDAESDAVGGRQRRGAQQRQGL